MAPCGLQSHLYGQPIEVKHNGGEMSDTCWVGIAIFFMIMLGIYFNANLNTPFDRG
jgi:hypothetical protein